MTKHGQTAFPPIRAQMWNCNFSEGLSEEYDLKSDSCGWYCLFPVTT